MHKSTIYIQRQYLEKFLFFFTLYLDKDRSCFFLFCEGGWKKKLQNKKVYNPRVLRLMYVFLFFNFPLVKFFFSIQCSKNHTITIYIWRRMHFSTNNVYRWGKTILFVDLFLLIFPPYKHTHIPTHTHTHKKNISNLQTYLIGVYLSLWSVVKLHHHHQNILHLLGFFFFLVLFHSVLG